MVGDRGVGVAISDHDLPVLEGRPNDLVDVVRLVGGKEQCLGAGTDVVPMQDEVANGSPQRRPARLTGRQDPGTGRFIRRHEGGDLTGLAGSVAALEGDEYPVAHPGEPKPRLRQGLLALGEFPQESGRDLAGGVARERT